MTEANYDKHMKVLGKMAHLYDTSAGDVTSQTLLVSVMMDQVAVGTIENTAAEKVYCEKRASWLSAIANGPTALKALAISMGTAYMRTADFTGDIQSSTVTSTSTIAAIVTALAADSVADDLTGGTGAVVAGTAGDGNIYDTEGSTGFVNFFEAVAVGDDGTDPGYTWGTDASPSIVDGTYVVAAAV